MNDAALEAVLDATAELIVHDGLDAVTIRAIARHTSLDEAHVLELVGTVEDALVLMLNREYAHLGRVIIDNVDRDPRGGLPSRIFFYTLAAVYERPLARTLYLIDPARLNQIMRTLHGFEYQPSTDARAAFLDKMISVGMSRRIDTRMVSALISTISAGLAITGAVEDYDRIIEGVEIVMASLVDAVVNDTTPGKAVFFDYVHSLGNFDDGSPGPSVTLRRDL